MVPNETMEQGFPTALAARLTGVTPKTLKNWSHRGFLKPSVVGGPRRASRYTFRDLVALRVAADLCARGIEVHCLTRVVEYLRRRKGLDLTTSEVLASTLLLTDGHDVYEVEGQIGISTLRRPNQSVMLVPFGRLVAEVLAAARKANSKAA